MAVVDESSEVSAEAVDSFSPRTVADRLTTLLRSIDWYNLLSKGVSEEVLRVVPGGEKQIRDLNDDEIAHTWFKVVNLLRARRLEPVLSLHGLPYPRYPIGGKAGGKDNVPPRTPAVWDPPRLPDASPGVWSVLGFDVGFPVGIPSSDLTTNADWLEYYAQKGFHVLTYRTVRNRPKGGNPYDWVFLEGIEKPWDLQLLPMRVRHREGIMPGDLRTISTATSFAAPSPPPDIWMPDVEKARARLADLGGRHLLIVSVTDSVPRGEKNDDTLSADFASVALKAEQAGAQAVELYLARATTCLESGELTRCERSVPTSIAIVEAVRSELNPDTKLLIKLSADLSQQAIEQIVVPLAQARLLDGVSGISPVEVDRVTTGDDNRPLWADEPDGRRPAVAGYALRKLSRDFVRRLAELRRTHKLDFDIIAMGGVMTPEDIAMYMGLGASAVQTATAAAFDPDLAEAAYAHYRARFKNKAVSNGFVLDVDNEARTFWARISGAEPGSPDMDALFAFDEVHPDQQYDVQPGAVFSWTTGLVPEGRTLVRQSLVRFRRLEPPTAESVATGKQLAENTLEVFGPLPELD